MSGSGALVGKVVVAVSAVGIVGFLVFSQGCKTKEIEPVKVVKDTPAVEKKLIISTNEGATYNWNELSDENKNNLVSKIYWIRVMKDSFLETTKAGPPPTPRPTYFIEMDGEKKNINEMSDQEWDDILVNTLKIEGGLKNTQPIRKSSPGDIIDFPIKN